MGDAHSVACLEATVVLEEKKAPCDIELEIVVASVLRVVKLCWEQR